MMRVIWAAVLCLGLAGCEASPVGASRVAKLGRDVSRADVEGRLGREGDCSCRVIQGGNSYEMFRYRVGRHGEPYLFVYRDGLLIKVCRQPAFAMSLKNPPPDMTDNYLAGRAYEVIHMEQDVQKPDDPPADDDGCKNAMLWAGWLMAFSPFIVMDSPVLIPMLIYDELKTDAVAGYGSSWLGESCDPVKRKYGVRVNARVPKCKEVRLGETEEELKKKFGEPLMCSDTGQGERWIRYSNQKFWEEGKAIAIELRDDHVVGVFDQQWIDDASHGGGSDEAF